MPDLSVSLDKRPWRMRGQIFGCFAGILLISCLAAAASAAIWKWPKGWPVSRRPPTATLRPTATPRPSPTPFPTPGPTQPYTPAFTLADCPFDVPQGASVECGWITLPEDRRGDPGDTIQLPIAIYRAASENPAPDPVTYLQGGPGAASLTWAAGFYETFIAPLAQERDVVVFDPRGAGLAQPALRCPEANQVQVEWYLDMATDEREQRYTQALKTCRDRLAAQGVNLAAYTIAESAADVRDIALTLGYRQINLYGISYGTRPAQYVMRAYPEIVRSVVLDSAVPVDPRLYRRSENIGLLLPLAGIIGPLGAAVPPEAKLPEAWDPASANASRIEEMFASCAANAACQAAFPALREEYRALMQQLRTEPLNIFVDNPAIGQEIFITLSTSRLESMLVWGLYSNAAAMLPQMIYDLRQNNTAILEYLLALPGQSYADKDLGVMLSINCHEVVFSLDPENAALPPLIDATGLSGIYDTDRDMFTACQVWGAAPFDAQQAQPVVSAIPTLLLAGLYDTATPPFFARKIAARLENGYFVELPGRGHAITPAGGCPLEIALEFLGNPARAPQTACAAKSEAHTAFIVPTRPEDIRLEPYRSEEYRFTALAPAGWQPVEYGFFNRMNDSLDPTQLGMQWAEVTPEQWIEFLMTNYQGKGLPTRPLRYDEIQANGLTWQLYALQFDHKALDLAFAERNGSTYLVILLSRNNDRNVLFEYLFLPVMRSVLPDAE